MPSREVLWDEKEQAIILEYVHNKTPNIKEAASRLPRRTESAVESRIRKMRSKMGLTAKVIPFTDADREIIAKYHKYGENDWEYVAFHMPIERTAESIRNHYNYHMLTHKNSTTKSGGPKTYIDRIPCLKCGKPFQSWDRRKNRLCRSCTLSPDMSAII